MGELISSEYLSVLKEMHASAPWGTTGHRYTADIVPFLSVLGCQSLLDYGAGTRSLEYTLRQSKPSIVVTNYDPAIAGIDTPPSVPCDFVVCSDVMEHVELQHVGAVLRHIRSLTRVACYFCIALVPAQRRLPDGRNTHITLLTPDEWLESIMYQDAGWYIVWKQISAKRMRVWLQVAPEQT